MGSRRPDRGLGITEREVARRADRARGLHGLGYILPRLRVRVDPEGRLDLAPPKPFGPRDRNEAWWQAVLTDWRLRPRRTRYHFDRLGEHSSATIQINCAQCNLRRQFQTSELLALYGPEYRMLYLRYELANCPAGGGFKECAVRYG
jgi:hypothetical protein